MKPFPTITQDPDLPQEGGFHLSWPGENRGEKRALPPGGARWGWRRRAQPFARGRLQPVAAVENTGLPVLLLTSKANTSPKA